MKLIIFDVDGTLVDSQAHILASMEGAFAALGLPAPTREATLGIVGLSLPVAMRHLMPEATDAEADALVDAYKSTFQDQRLNLAGASPLYPGTRNMLDRLRSQDEVLLGVATGKSRRGLDHVIQHHDLSGFFITTQVADDHPSKPHPSMIEAALSETGVEPKDAVMIGDTEFDMDMGRAAGVKTIGVTWGYHPAERLQADRIISDWSLLGAILSGLWEVA